MTYPRIGVGVMDLSTLWLRRSRTAARRAISLVQCLVSNGRTLDELKQRQLTPYGVMQRARFHEMVARQERELIEYIHQAVTCARTYERVKQSKCD